MVVEIVVNVKNNTNKCEGMQVSRMSILNSNVDCGGT